MFILGISDATHDRSVCLSENGKIVVAIEEERITRHKHALDQKLFYSPDRHKIRAQNLQQCISYCLETRGISEREVEDTYISSLFNKPAVEGKVVPHHLAHAASTFYPSAFDSAAILVIDGAGGCVGQTNLFETVSYWHGNENNISGLKLISGQSVTKVLNKGKNIEHFFQGTQNSIGTFYKLIGLCNGMGPFDAGKTMGLASYGSLHHKLPDLERHIHCDSQGNLTINNQEIYKLLVEFKKNQMDPIKNQSHRFQLSADLAFKAQSITENLVLNLCKFLFQQTKSKKLCLAGGVGLNSVINYKILEQTPFEEVFIQPAAGDNGLSIGAALWGFHAEKKMPRKIRKAFNPYLGKTYTVENILPSYQAYKKQLNAERLSYESAFQKAAQYISQGKIVGWFQDGSEIGPRALGNRSILADPRKAENKDLLNLKVKHRESFRPFAPVVLEEEASNYFMISCSSPYMLLVPPVIGKMQSVIPAVTHVDGSARLQTVSKQLNKKFYRLIQEFERLTGVPVILNTSFNDRGQPIVETPKQALDFFISTQIDVLFIQNYMFLKNSL